MWHVIEFIENVLALYDAKKGIIKTLRGNAPEIQELDRISLGLSNLYEWPGTQSSHVIPLAKGLQNLRATYLAQPDMRSPRPRARTRALGALHVHLAQTIWQDIQANPRHPLSIGFLLAISTSNGPRCDSDLSYYLYALSLVSKHQENSVFHARIENWLLTQAQAGVGCHRWKCSMAISLLSHVSEATLATLRNLAEQGFMTEGYFANLYARNYYFSHLLLALARLTPPAQQPNHLDLFLTLTQKIDLNDNSTAAAFSYFVMMEALTALHALNAELAETIGIVFFKLAAEPYLLTSCKDLQQRFQAQDQALYTACMSDLQKRIQELGERLRTHTDSESGYLLLVDALLTWAYANRDLDDAPHATAASWAVTHSTRQFSALKDSTDSIDRAYIAKHLPLGIPSPQRIATAKNPLKSFLRHHVMPILHAWDQAHTLEITDTSIQKFLKDPAYSPTAIVTEGKPEIKQEDSISEASNHSFWYHDRDSSEQTGIELKPMKNSLPALQATVASSNQQSTQANTTTND